MCRCTARRAIFVCDLFARVFVCVSAADLCVEEYFLGNRNIVDDGDRFSTYLELEVVCQRTCLWKRIKTIIILITLVIIIIMMMMMIKIIIIINR